MNPNPLEKDIERKIGEYAKKKGVRYMKFTSPANRAVPDRMLICNGVVAFLEIKRKGQKPTPLQMKEMQALKDSLCNVGWVDNVEKGVEFINLVITKCQWPANTVVMGEGLA